jgi:sugar phosphate isomerase/epimerase
MTAPLSAQLYSLGALPAEDPSAVVAKLAELGYVGVEPVLATGSSDAMREFARSMGAEDLPAVDAHALKRALDEHGLVAHASHVQLPEGDVAEAILDEQELLGSTMIVVPALFDAEANTVESFADLDRIKRLAERFNVAAERARPRGIRVGYHNHFWEFATDFDGRSGLELFYELVEPDVFAEVDIYWAQLGGRDPLDLVRTLGERAVLLHVKDGDGTLGSPSCALGSGVVDLTGVLTAATAATWHVVELEGIGPDAIWPALEASARHLVDAGLSTGRSG